MKAQFGADVSIETIESTAAAEGQGAVHCLTITVPKSASVFETADAGRVAETLERRRVLEQGNDRLTAPSLIGRWEVRRLGTIPTVGENLQVAFDDKRIRIQLDSETVSGTYQVMTDSASAKPSEVRWPLEISFDKLHGKTHARVDWISDHQAVLILEDGDTFRLRKEPALTDLSTEDRVVTLDKELKGRLEAAAAEGGETSLVQAWAYHATAGERVSFLARSSDFSPQLMVAGPGIEGPLAGETMTRLRMSALDALFPETGLPRRRQD